MKRNPPQDGGNRLRAGPRSRDIERTRQEFDEAARRELEADPRVESRNWRLEGVPANLARPYFFQEFPGDFFQEAWP